MSKRTLSSKVSSRPFSAARMFEGLEDRRMMSVAPSTIANATVNDTVFDANANELHVVYYDTAAKAVKFQSFDAGGATRRATPGSTCR
jgi:hypothetical protein